MDNDNYDSFDNLLTSNMDFAYLTNQNIGTIEKKILKAKRKGLDDKFTVGKGGRGNILAKPITIDVQKDTEEDIRSKLLSAEPKTGGHGLVNWGKNYKVKRQIGPEHKKRIIKNSIKAGVAAVAIPLAAWGGVEGGRALVSKLEAARRAALKSTAAVIPKKI